MKSLGYFHLEAAEKLTNNLRQKGIGAESLSAKTDNAQFPVIPNIGSHLGDQIGEAGYLEVSVLEDNFSLAQSIRKEMGIPTIQEELAQLPISEKNLNTILEVGKAGRLFSALVTGGSAKERGEVEMGLPEWYQLMGTLFNKDTLSYFQKNTKRKIWLTLLLSSGVLLLVTWLYFGIYKSIHLQLGYFLLGWLELGFVTLAAVLKERFGSVLGITFGVLGTVGILLVVLALTFLV